MPLAGRTFAIDRRRLLIGGGIGAGLVVGWSLWPRRYVTSLRAGPGETIFNAFLKIGVDGRVMVAVPQAELGQGVYTSLPQVLADELGADWKTIGVEPAPYGPLYANPLLSDALTVESEKPHDRRDGDLMLTGGSTSIRAFEAKMREAGAAARVLLCKAAAARWKIDWRALDAHAGFIWNGNSRISFGDLAEEASTFSLPGDLPMREGNEHRLTGAPLLRLDLPSKVDGTAQFAGDIRLPGMLFASVRQGPPGGRLTGFDRAAAEKVPGVRTVIDNPHWVGAVATNWWAANRAVEAMRPQFALDAASVVSLDIDQALISAMSEGEARVVAGAGDVKSAMAQGGIFSASYAVGPAPTAALEPLTATARYTGGRLEIWAPTQAPGFARDAAARALGLSPNAVTLYPTFVGGGYGRKLETTAIAQAAVVARKIGKPVQLTWSRIEETLHDTFRPPARATLSAALSREGVIQAWRARIAAPATSIEAAARLRGEQTWNAKDADPASVAGALPPYTIPAVSIEYVPAPVPIQTGMWRSAAHSYTAFFTESFVDELARHSGLEPMSFRMQILTDNARLARALAAATATGGWDGGAPGSAMGLAVHSAFGSHVALMVEVEVDSNQRVRVLRAVCAVDCGRVINPEIVRQQIEGGILFGIAGATGAPIDFERGLPTAIGFKDLALPTLANAPEVVVELITSQEDPGGVTELAVPPVAPAIANALFALTGQRLRSLPLATGTAV
jgi:isoquinoline 1-oxidoreductase beta subunit